MGGTGSIIDGVIANGGQRLDRALADASGLSRERIKALLGEGRITLGGRAVDQASLKPAAGTAFAIAVPAASPASAEAQDIALTIVYEDADLIVIDGDPVADLTILAKPQQHLKAVIRDGRFLIDRLDRTAQLAAAE